MVKNLPANGGDLGSIPGSGRSPLEGNGNPLQCSCLENPMDRGAWRATVHGVAESQTDLVTEHTHTYTLYLKLQQKHLGCIWHRFCYKDSSGMPVTKMITG